MLTMSKHVITYFFYSIRINKQWRIIFKWNNGNVSEVEITDYHIQ